MKSQIRRTTVIRSIATVLSVILLHPWGTTPASALDRDNDDRGKCDFSLQLQQDPALRDAYIDAVNRSNDTTFARTGDVDSMYRNVVPVRNSRGELVGIDAFSNECITCHDGMTATYHNARFMSAGGTSSRDMGSVVGSHPIGMIYESYVGKPDEFRGAESLNREMVFVGGRIGCLTCHNPLDTGKYHLVAANTGSAICLSCHIR